MYQKSCRVIRPWLIILLIITLLYLTLKYTKQNTGDKVRIPDHLAKVQVLPSETAKSAKLILAYTNIYGRAFDITTYGRTKYEQAKSPNPLDECQYRCEWTTDRSQLNRSDAVLFHLYNNLQNKDMVISKLPRRYSQEQKWILMAREPQAFYYPEQLLSLDDMFNLTMTFKTSSDIQIPYGSYWPLSAAAKAARARSEQDYLQGKARGLVWMASNCRTSSRREEFVKELQKYIDVDVYGKCGNLSTHSQSANGYRDELAKAYRFYIAFENSDCEDYISEKFWNSLHIGMIPIVRGLRANYHRLAPPNSYIQVEHFITVQKLAEHLTDISNNSTLFHKYHQWRRDYDANYKFFTTNTAWMCDLCTQVHTSPQKTVKVSEYFGEDRQCSTYLSHNGRDRNGEHVEDLYRV